MTPLHFVGSLGLDTAETAFRTFGEIIGARTHRYPDGEPGGRSNWIGWQDRAFAGHPDFDIVEMETRRFGTPVVRPYYKLKSGVNPAELRFAPLGYAEDAIASYGVFRRLREEGVIPSGTRFQVSLPTPVAAMSAFVVEADKLRVESAYERALAAEVARIADAVPRGDLAFQWDVCHEIVGHDGGLELYYDDPLDGAVERLIRLGATVPDGAELGYHLCYGDPAHKHIIEPETTATAVAFANRLAVGLQRPIHFLHLPVPRGRDDDAYFAPLADLSIAPETELYLGLLHFTDGVEGARRRRDAAARTVRDFGLATECGFGRRDPATIRDLLRLHAEMADAG